MRALVIGIDPGNSGAIAVLSLDARLVEVLDIPCVKDGTKGRRTINAALLAALIREQQPIHAFIELIGPWPTDAKVAAFSFGRCRGTLEGICGALAIPVTMITVPSWRRAVGLPVGSTKEQARGEAIRRWPAYADRFARVRDDGRAEACLIGLAGLMREARK